MYDLKRRKQRKEMMTEMNCRLECTWSIHNIENKYSRKTKGKQVKLRNGREINERRKRQMVNIKKETNERE